MRKQGKGLQQIADSASIRRNIELRLGVEQHRSPYANSADLGRFTQIPAGTGFHFEAVSMAEAQAEVRKFAELLRTLPDRLRDIESFDLNIEALQDANVAGAAVSAVDARTWQVSSPADALTQD